MDWYPTTTVAKNYLPFLATGVRWTGDDISCQVVGELHNPFTAAVGSMAVTTLYRDGAGTLLSGSTSFVDALPASGTLPFSVSDLSGRCQKPAAVDVHAMPWGGDPEEWNRLAGA